jgi:uncharacterized protein YjiS (DUF1127 family)
MSTQALWSIAKTTVSGRPSSGLHRACDAIFAGTKTYLAWISKWRRVRRAVRELESLDEHTLKDIGVCRCEIRSAVHYGREI